MVAHSIGQPVSTFPFSVHVYWMHGIRFDFGVRFGCQITIPYAVAKVRSDNLVLHFYLARDLVSTSTCTPRTPHCMLQSDEKVRISRVESAQVRCAQVLPLHHGPVIPSVLCTAAFVSGGLLPASVRGTVQHGMIHVCDWCARCLRTHPSNKPFREHYNDRRFTPYVPMYHRYRTFGVLAGVLPTEGVVPAVNYEGARVPPLDSLDMWPLLTKKVDSSPRKGFPLSQFAIIQGQYKYDCHMRFAQPRVMAFMLSTIGLLRYVVVPKCCLCWAGQIYQRIHPRS